MLVERACEKVSVQRLALEHNAVARKNEESEENKEDESVDENRTTRVKKEDVKMKGN